MTLLEHANQRSYAFLRAGVLLLAAAVLVAPNTSATAEQETKASNKANGKGNGQAKGNGPKGGGSGGGNPAPAQVVRPDVLLWLLANNPGLRPDFLRQELPDKVFKLPDGQSLPLYRLKQFHDVNFRLEFYARKQEKGSEIVPIMEERLKKLMCLPEYHDFIKQHRSEYKIHGKKVSAEQAYHHFRHIHRRLGVTAGAQYKAPVGGGDGIAAPSWAVFKAMNIFHHEACHCLGINHDSGGLSGPLSGALRKWDRQKKWNYALVDLNTTVVRR